MSTVRCTMAQAVVRCLCNQFTDHRWREGAAVSPASLRFSDTATSPACPKRSKPYKTVCRPGAARTNSRWRSRRSALPRRNAAARSWSRPSSIGPGALNMVTAAGVAHANRLPVLLISGDTFVEPPSRSGAAAGRAFRRPVDHRQRRVQGGDALLGPDHPSGADHLVVAAGGRRRCSIPPIAARPSSRCRRTFRKLRSTIPRPSSSRPDSTRFRDRGPTGDRWRRPRRCSKRAKKPLIISGGGVRYSLAERRAGEFAVRARHPDRRNHRRQGRAHSLSSGARRADRHHRLDLGQCAGRRG